MLDAIRAQFPALERRHNGHPVAYFDGPGGTQTPVAVVQAMSDYLLHHNANEGWDYPTSHETDAILLEARHAMADLLNAAPEGIVFGQNMTSLTFHVSRAIGRRLTPGDEIIVTELDHHGNVDPWKQMARDVGAVIRVARMIPETCQLDWPHLESLVSGRTKLIAIGGSSNAVGTVSDIPRAVALARSAGALCFVDGVHFVPHKVTDVEAWDCDFLACSAYKFYGPHTGILYARPSLLQSLDVHKLEPSKDYGPARAETGTQSFESIHGTAAAVNFLASLGEGSTRREKLVSAYRGIGERSSALFERLWTGLKANPRVRAYGLPPGASRSATISFTVDGYTAREVAIRLAAEGIFVSHGNFYALTVVRRLGLEDQGLVRVGLACYNSAAEIDRLLGVLSSL